jgi:hypothetical protein
MADEFDPEAFADALVSVYGPGSVIALPPDTQAVILLEPSDDVLRLLVTHLPGLRHIVMNGEAAEVTDDGVAHIATLESLESLDLEGSDVTDVGLERLGALEQLQWVDLSGSPRVTQAGVSALRARRPSLSIDAGGL